MVLVDGQLYSNHGSSIQFKCVGHHQLVDSQLYGNPDSSIWFKCVGSISCKPDATITVTVGQFKQVPSLMVLVDSHPYGNHGSIQFKCFGSISCNPDATITVMVGLAVNKYHKWVLHSHHHHRDHQQVPSLFANNIMSKEDFWFCLSGVFLLKFTPFT